MTCGVDALAHLSPGHVADQAPRQAAVLAFGDGLLDRVVDVGADLQLGARELPALAVEADPQRVAQRRQQALADESGGFVFVEAADVDAGDADPSAILSFCELS